MHQNSVPSLVISSISQDISVICDRWRSEFRQMSRPTHAMHRFANPARFLRLSAALRPWALGVTLLTLVAGLWLALFDSPPDYQPGETRSEEHTSELQSLMRNSYAVFCLKNKI